MKYVWLLCIPAALVVLAFLPAVLARVLDPINVRTIRRRLAASGITDIEIKPWPNHYGVTFVRDGQKQYAKCKVVGRKITWKGENPEREETNRI